MGKIMSFEEFQEKVKNATNGRISIVRESYRGVRYPVTAYCNIHKIYFTIQYAGNLLREYANCPKCLKELRKKRGQEMIKPWKDVLESFINEYGNMFSYDETTYNGTKELMKVHCNDCGADFEITPEHHLRYNNGGCPNCKKYRIVKCSCCGKEIIADYHINGNAKIYCDECKMKSKMLSKVKNYTELDNKEIEQLINEHMYCQICGRKLNKDLKCDNDFCNCHNISIFNTLIKYFNFDKNKLKTTDVENEYNRVRNMLYDMYWNKNMSTTEIAELFKYPFPGNLSNKVFRYLNIPTKSLSQAIQENIKMNRLTIPDTIHYKSGHHTTWDNKVFLLRSGYEFDFAKFLDEQKISYEVEKIRITYFDTQQNKERIAIPDFYIIETNTIIEVKSKWTLDKQNMIDKRDAYLKSGYNFKLWYEHEFVELDTIEEYSEHI